MTQAFEQLRQQVEQSQRELDRLRGASDELKSRLKLEFGVSSMKEAREKLSELQQHLENLQTEFETSMQKFLEEWDEPLGGFDDHLREG